MTFLSEKASILMRNSHIFVISRVFIEKHCPHTPKAIDLPKQEWKETKSVTMQKRYTLITPEAIRIEARFI
jgi:hypothetical protein